MNEEISLIGKNEQEIVDAYYSIAVKTQADYERYERVPDLIETFVENYCNLDEIEEDEI